jgi:hypothetical protein
MMNDRNQKAMRRKCRDRQKVAELTFFVICFVASSCRRRLLKAGTRHSRRINVRPITFSAPKKVIALTSAVLQEKWHTLCEDNRAEERWRLKWTDFSQGTRRNDGKSRRLFWRKSRPFFLFAAFCHNYLILLGTRLALLNPSQPHPLTPSP